MKKTRLQPASKKITNINTLENLSTIYPWAEDMVRGKGGTDALRKPASKKTPQVSEKQRKIIRGER